MPAGPIGACWKAGSWSATAWEANTWADAASIAAILGDLTTLFTFYAWHTLKDAHPAAKDVNTLIRDDHANAVSGSGGEDDENTRYAKYLS